MTLTTASTSKASSDDSSMEGGSSARPSFVVLPHDDETRPNSADEADIAQAHAASPDPAPADVDTASVGVAPLLGWPSEFPTRPPGVAGGHVGIETIASHQLHWHQYQQHMYQMQHMPTATPASSSVTNPSNSPVVSCRHPIPCTVDYLLHVVFLCSNSLLSQVHGYFRKVFVRSKNYG